jgi:transposase InsO family protein
VAAIEELRRRRLTGPQIARQLGLPRSTMGLVLRRLGLGRLRDLEPRPVAVRYQRSRPGELIHLDTKKLGRFETVGHRFAGRGPGRHANRGSGFDHVHVCIDDVSRLAYSEILPSDGQHDATAFLERAMAWLQQHGVTVERVMTDNGSAYRSKLFASTLRRAGLRHIRTKPYTPRTNGKAERFIQTALREWAYAAPYASSNERSTAIKPWIGHYNTSRPHAGIDGLSPWVRLNNLLGNDT